ncbi:MAG: ComEC/Rec2 family competence protein, partial [Proteobacteria bacterium]|nr:ComEC/Rec2 family competence protein [Pseudomonadota bacterium]
MLPLRNFGYFEKLLEFYKNAFPSPHSSLVAGVVIGSKEGISGNFWESLKNSGTLHVVVASGMNVTLVAGFLMTLFLS